MLHGCFSLILKYIRSIRSKNDSTSKLNKNPKDKMKIQTHKNTQISSKNRKETANYTGIIVSSQEIKKLVVMFFHGLFFISSICIVLFMPNLDNKSNRNTFESNVDIILLGTNSSKDINNLNSTSYNQVNNSSDMRTQHFQYNQSQINYPYS